MTGISHLVMASTSQPFFNTVIYARSDCSDDSCLPPLSLAVSATQWRLPRSGRAAHAQQYISACRPGLRRCCPANLKQMSCQAVKKGLLGLGGMGGPSVAAEYVAVGALAGCRSKSANEALTIPHNGIIAASYAIRIRKEAEDIQCVLARTYNTA
jgi:hypothetical protein